MRAHGRVRHEAAAEDVVHEAVVYRGEAHAQVMRHDAAHALAAAARAARGSVVHGLPEPEAAREAEGAEPSQVPHGRARLHRQRQKARIGRDHPLRAHAAPERQGGAAVGLVAVAERRVQRVEGALRLAPGLAVRHVVPLDVEAKARALPEQALPAQREKELRHEVFEHRPRPAGHAPVAVLGDQGAGEPPPVPPRDLAPGHAEIARQPGLAREQVVKPLRELARALVPADAEEPAARVVERAEVHRLVERLGPGGEVRAPVVREPAPGPRTARRSARPGGSAWIFPCARAP